MTRARRGAIIAAAVAAGALGVCLVMATDRDLAPVPPASLPATATPVAAPATHLVSTPAAAPAAASIEDQVRAWSASANPADWMQAFQAIENCLRLERDKELVVTDVKVTKQGPGAGVELVSSKLGDAAEAALRQSCAPMTGRTRLDRYQLLERAVDAHAGGALALYIAQGPQGDRNALRERPADPLVIAWRDAALRRLQDGIDRGYVDVLLTAQTDYAALAQDQAPADVYTQQLAANKITAAINHDAGFYPQMVLDGAARALDAQQRRDAELAAARIFAAWKARQR